LPAVVDTEKCTACGTCVDACPGEAITLEEYAVVNPEECTDCGTCEDECPEGAITIEEE